MSMDLSYLEALMGGGTEQPEEKSGGVWVVSPQGAADPGILRLVGKARVLADSLGSYVYLLLAGEPDREASQSAIRAGADRVVVASGLPTVSDLAEFFGARSPQVLLFPRSYLGRVLGPGLAERLGGGVVGYAVDVIFDSSSQHVVALAPVMDGAASQNVSILAGPAIVVLDTGALPAAFSEPWRTGEVEEAGVNWQAPMEYRPGELPAAAPTLATAPLVVAAGRDAGPEGFALAERLAQALGGAVAGDVGALDAGWITGEQLVDLTGTSVAPRLYLALGVEGETTHFLALQNAANIVAVHDDPAVPIRQVADWNVVADPVEFAQALLAKLEAQR
jgi:electron transfer flavoprotein alpha subunit